MYALVDCNNFYVSCERVFQPELENRPTIVMSNNDGCAIARSNEVKALGVSMGAPIFKIQDVINKHNIQLRSANFTLYGDMSQRVSQILMEEAPRAEIYSIDESFLDVDVPNPDSFCRHLHQRVRQWTGIPVSVGYARTKTLSKLANSIAKKGTGVHYISPERETEVLDKTPTGKVWGVGRRISVRLEEMGIKTALQLRDAPSDWIRSRFSVVLSRTKMELAGIVCADLEFEEPERREIITSRSFGKKVTKIGELRQAVASFIHRAVEKLRARDLECGSLMVTVNTNPYSKNDEQYHRSSVCNLPDATSDVRTLTGWATTLLHQIYKPGIEYARAGVALMDLRSKDCHQTTLFSVEPEHDPTMEIVDQIKQRFGRSAIATGATLSGCGTWVMNQSMLSKRYTTRWSDLVVIG